MKKLTTNQVANMAGLTPSGIRHHVREGELKAETVPYPVSEGGEQYRYEPLDVLNFLESKKLSYHIKLSKITERLRTMEGSIKKLRREVYGEKIKAVHGADRN